jgi:hypothetical protein
MTDEWIIAIALAIVISFLVGGVFFLIEQQRILQIIRPENRLLSPGRVWRQLIPLYGMVYQFIVVTCIADSIRQELAATAESDWLAGAYVTESQRPTYKYGITMAVLSCCTIIRFPWLETLISLAVLIAWILYWRELRKYHQEIRQRWVQA